MTVRRSSTVNGGQTAPLSEGCYPRPARSPASADAGRVTLVCYRADYATFIEGWDSVADAVEATRICGPCDKGCVGAHAVVSQVAGRIRTTPVPTPTVLITTVVPGSSRTFGSHVRLVDCPFCGNQHAHVVRHIGTVRASGCLRGFYHILREDESD